MIFKNEKRPQCTKCLWQLTTDGDCVNPDCDWYVLEPVSLRSQMPRSVKSSDARDVAVLPEREAVELLAIMWSKRGYVSPPRDPQDYVATASCAEAIETADTLRALLARAEAAEARADIDQSAYEELLRESKRQAQRIKELEADRDAAVLAERRDCCATVYGYCSSDNEAQRIVDAICARSKKGDG